MLINQSNFKDNVQIFKGKIIPFSPSVDTNKKVPEYLKKVADDFSTDRIFFFEKQLKTKNPYLKSQYVNDISHRLAEAFVYADLEMELEKNFLLGKKEISVDALNTYKKVLKRLESEGVSHEFCSYLDEAADKIMEKLNKKYSKSNFLNKISIFSWIDYCIRKRLYKGIKD